ncbi:unnamed protein product [Blepharisma stoltei]|uniref:Uncharacterized protein n=1 Tax=Blepharisma stoltei TaxID=1481888 RepID=A0AAU9JUQ4_9CILI|nr:unnamed protein product [Blepharisma stoltei]
MSIYSGFATRSLESTYNAQISRLISLLHDHVYATIRCLPFDNQLWIDDFSKTYHTIVKLEDQKYQLPKYSKFTQELGEYLKPRASLCSSKQTSTADTAYKLIDEKLSFINTSIGLINTTDDDILPNLPKGNDTGCFTRMADYSVNAQSRAKSRMHIKRKSPHGEKDWNRHAKELYMAPITEKKSTKLKHLHKYQDEALMSILKDLSRHV